jgi:hypothetical protein
MCITRIVFLNEGWEIKYFFRQKTRKMGYKLDKWGKFYVAITPFSINITPFTRRINDVPKSKISR